MTGAQSGKAKTQRNDSRHHQLDVRDICVFYGEAKALDGLYLSVGAGEIVAVLGSNGAGKTTLLRTVTGVLKPRTGDINFLGEAIGGRSPSNVIRKGITSVPEGGELFGPMSVADNLLLGAYSLSRRERKEKLPLRLQTVYDTFPVLKERTTQLAQTLSGGERQMLAVARALMSSPKLVALDEPSLGLSPVLVTEMMQLLKRICHEMGMSILLVEQNAKAALKIADYAYVLERGRIVLEGDSRQVGQDPSIYAAYLGG
jgi:branched-chain amino acid transport system ATP-binding protein